MTEREKSNVYLFFEILREPMHLENEEKCVKSTGDDVTQVTGNPRLTWSIERHCQSVNHIT